MLLRSCVTVFLISMLLPACAFAAEQFHSEADAIKHCAPGTVVWLNTSTGREHEKGSKWYGHTKAGVYLCKGEERGRAEAGKDGKWAALGRIDAFDGGAVIYVDSSSIRRQQDNVDMWVLMDFKNAQELAGMKFLSSRLHKEFDCKDKRWRILASSVLDKNMGEGKTLQSDEEADEWRAVETESIAETEFETACSKR